MKFKIDDMIYLKRHLNLNYINSIDNQDIITDYYNLDIELKDVEINQIGFNLRFLSDYEIIELLDLFDVFINFIGSVSNEIIDEIDDELNKRFDNKINHLLSLNHDEYYDLTFKDDLSDDDKLINRFLNYTYDLIDIFYHDDNKSVSGNYNELIDSISVLTYQDVLYDIDDLFEISNRLSYYVDYDAIIDDLISDDFYYEFDDYYFINSLF